MKILPALMAGLALAHALPATAAVDPAKAYSDRIARLSSIEQRSVMRRAILDNAQYCKQVLSTAYQQPYKNVVMWTAACAKGGDYAVYIGPDGSAQVRPCKDLAKLGLPACRPPKSVAQPRR